MLINLFQAFGKIEKCADIARERIWLQMVIVLFVSMLEALFIFILIPFLEIFDQSPKAVTDAPSFIANLLNPIFNQIGLPYNLYTLASLLCLVAFLRETASVINQYSLQILAGKVEVGVQRKVVSKTMAATYLSTSQLGSGKFMELCNICARESSKAILDVLKIYSILITLISYFFVLILTTPTVAGIAFLLAFISFLCLNFTAKKASAAGENIVRIRETLAQRFQNIFFHIREIKINNRVSSLNQSIELDTDHLFDLTLRSKIIGVKLRSILTMVLLSGSLFLIIILRDENLLDLAVLTAGLAMVMRLLPLVLNFTRIRQGFAATYPYVEQLEKYVVNCEQNEEIDNGKLTFDSLNEGLELRGVHFTYPYSSKSVLHSLNVSIKKGHSTALVGLSGAGKSTLIDLLPKLIKPVHGEILIDGKNLDSFSNQSLRNGIAYVPQSPNLHDGSIRFNICFSEDQQNDGQISKIISDVGLGEFVRNLPDGLDTQIGSTAIKLSGGQAQRLAIARAVFKKALIVILDEPTSALDIENTELISSLIYDLSRKNRATVIVISHSWNIVSKLDHMIKLESGRATYQGKPNKRVMGSGTVDPEFNKKKS